LPEISTEHPTWRPVEDVGLPGSALWLAGQARPVPLRSATTAYEYEEHAMDEAQEQSVMRLLIEVCGTDAIDQERDVDLFDAGLLDSLGFTQLLVGLEDDLGISVPPTAVERDDVATVNRILSFVAERL
jgi:D-alanine--poly(phosphoribitol) ligase subunit 2